MPSNQPLQRPSATRSQTDMTRGYHKGAFSVDGAEGSRFDLAVERFCSGETFEFREIAFRVEADGVVHCMVDSSWHSGNITPATAARAP